MNKGLKVFIGVIIAIIVIWGIVFCVDYVRCANFKMPIFVVAGATADDGGSGTYYGLGYKVEVKKNLSAEYGVQLEKVEMYMFNKFITGAIAEVQKDTVIITDGKIENENLIDDFINETSIDTLKKLNILLKENGSETNIQITFVPREINQENDIITEHIPETAEDYQKEYGYYIFSINGEEKARYDTIRWKIERITTDGKVTLCFTSRAEVTEFPEICEYDLEGSNYVQKFEMNYNQRKDLGIKTIIDKDSSDKYDYSVCTFGGDVTITIEGDMVYSLEDALSQNVISVEDILNQAKMDETYGLCESGYCLDGGSTEYLYTDYTILKYNTLDGNKDLYIGMRGQIINKINNIIE
ncbi:MAG: hypothetical protein ACI4U9_00185 [Clostridia bacterium]